MSTGFLSKPTRLARRAFVIYPAITIAMLSILAAGTGSAFADSSLGQQSIIKDGPYTITNKNSGYCLGVAGDHRSINAPLVQWFCDGSQNQMWTIWTTPDFAAASLHNQGANANYCAGPSGYNARQGAPMVLLFCGGDDALNWSVNFGETIDQQISNFNFWGPTGLCLGIPGSSRAEGARVVVWSCNTHDDQVWELSPV